MKKNLGATACCLVLAGMLLIWGNARAAGKDIVLETNRGTIRIQLYDDKAPVTAANFRRYVKDSFYDGLTFHRAIPGFVIQGGGFEPGMKRRPPTHPPIKNEADNGLKNKRGTLSMARTNDINSATSQFFINVADNAALDHRGPQPRAFGYAVFGRVVAGMDVVDKIVASPTTTVGRYHNVPIRDAVIVRAHEK